MTKDIISSGEFEEKFREHCRKFVASFTDGDIHASELKNLKHSFQSAIDFSSGLSPQEYLLDSGIISRDALKTGNTDIFDDIYFSSWTPHTAGAIVKKLGKITAPTPKEAEVATTLGSVAAELVAVGKALKAVKPLSGKRKPPEEWQRPVEPDRFTCSCCFRRQARNPAQHWRLADHGFVKAGYRKGVCPGSSFPPLEDDGSGNLAFMKAVRRSLETRLAKATKTTEPEEMFRILRMASMDEDDIMFREFIARGMEEAGGYAAFVEKRISPRRTAYDAHLYRCVAAFGGLDFLSRMLVEFRDEKEKTIFRQWLSERFGWASLYDVSVNPGKYARDTENIGDPLIREMADIASASTFLLVAQAAPDPDAVPAFFRSIMARAGDDPENRQAEKERAAYPSLEVKP